MMDYRAMMDWELLAERSHMEQLGFNGEIQILEIDEELTRRRAEKADKPATMVREDIKGKVLQNGKHRTHKRYVSSMGNYEYTPIETELNEMMVQFSSHYPGSIAHIVYDDLNEIQKIKTSGAGSRTFNEAIKKTASKWFEQEYRN
jgi:hypothetical protein